MGPTRPAHGNAPYLHNGSVVFFQAAVDNQVGMNGSIVQLPHNSHAVQGWSNRAVAPFTGYAIAGAEPGEPASTDVFSNDYHDFGPAVSQQGHEVFGMTAPETDIGVRPTSPDVSRSVSADPVTPANGHNPRYWCSGCNKNFFSLVAVAETVMFVLTS
ncbi:hypothetical protein N431DRAFT_460963 [Stipitochalara longipes BDJ]|nr:hypothetical protein N431DRAFT_460963 [Stipitochalara longipes BDJ]